MLIRPAYCKLNLVLDVTARRDDGWHDIDSLLVPLDWHDLVSVRVRRADDAAVSLRITGPGADRIPVGSENLAARAAAELARAAGAHLAVDVWLEKRVPDEAGLGGGSADAAAVLRAGAEQLSALGMTVGMETLLECGLAVGSDVPALLAGGAQRVRGRGERLQAVPARRLHVAVAIAGRSQTAAAYSALRPDEVHAAGRVERLIAELQSATPPDAHLGSALEPAARRVSPDLADSIDRLRGLTPGRHWHLTGSGGALFSVARHPGDALELTERARDAGFSARACRSIDG